MKDYKKLAEEYLKKQNNKYIDAERLLAFAEYLSQENPKEECRHDSDKNWPKHCSDCGSKDLCFMCVDDHTCPQDPTPKIEPVYKKEFDGSTTTTYVMDYDKTIILLIEKLNRLI